jgi:hypothetical protein
LKGKHNRDLDREEYLRIIKAGEKDDLQGLLDAVDEKLSEELSTDGSSDIGSNMIPESYELVIECKDEADQKVKFDQFRTEGLRVRILNL